MKVLCETSVRHIHLDEDGLTALFGKGAKLTPDRPLSQPKQFLCKERVTLVGPKNSYENVGIIGPARDVMQAEISRTDSFYLGIKNVPMRLSRDVDGAPVITVKNGDKKIDIPVIVAMRHVHLDPLTAEKIKVKHGEIRSIKFEGERSAILNNVAIRIGKDYKPAIHLDSDEANAVFAGDSAEII